MEQQAIDLLMKKSGVLAQDEECTEQAQEAFAEQFEKPVLPEIIDDLRDMFGIKGTTANDLAALVSQAGEVGVN